MSLNAYHREVDYIVRDHHPLLHGIAQTAEWIREDEFPAAPEWADEHEKWLRFVDGKGQWNRLRPRLVKSAYQRDRTFSEIGIAYFLEQMCSLPIVEWEPDGNDGTKGEYLVDAKTDQIFVEVKTGGWQKDIKDAEGSTSLRFAQPKYIHAEARSVSNSQVIRNAVTNGYKKFGGSRPNLLVIKDDYWVDLDDHLGPDIALYRSGDGLFRNQRYDRLGGVGIFRVQLSGDGLTYHFSLCENPMAMNPVKLPQNAFHGYPRRSE